MSKQTSLDSFIHRRCKVTHPKSTQPKPVQSKPTHQKNASKRSSKDGRRNSSRECSEETVRLPDDESEVVLEVF
jgi:hypothetical protein